MTNRWLILGVLFAARTAMAFQFQSVPALSPLILDAWRVGLADVGLLIGLYLAPGVVVSVPGGAVAARFGDKRIVVLGMLLMLAGGALVAFAPGWNAMVVGRLVAGAGGVVLNIVMTKMLVDWFAGREISTAMAIFVNSWPVGIALALAALPLLAGWGGLAAAWWAVTVVIGATLAAFAAFYRPPPGASASGGRIGTARLPVYALLLASLVWALYNTALAMVFSFGPALLTGNGWSLAEAGSAISLFMLVFSAAAPVGGILSDRTGRRDAIIMASIMSFPVLVPLALAVPASATVPLLVAVAALFALAAGPIMTLPSDVLPPESRTFGMGVFFSVYYGVMMVAPRIAGGLADRTGDAGAAFLAGVAAALGAVAALLLFRSARARRIAAE